MSLDLSFFVLWGVVSTPRLAPLPVKASGGVEHIILYRGSVCTRNRQDVCIYVCMYLAYTYLFLGQAGRERAERSRPDRQSGRDRKAP